MSMALVINMQGMQSLIITLLLAKPMPAMVLAGYAGLAWFYARVQIINYIHTESIIFLFFIVHINKHC
jgi:hypothetical protein